MNKQKCPSLEEHDSHCGCGESNYSQETNCGEKPNNQMLCYKTQSSPDTFASLIAELENQELVYHRNSERIAKIEAYKKAQKIVEDAIEKCNKNAGEVDLIDVIDLKKELEI